MMIYLTVLFGLLGAAIGSFINVVVDRLPAGKSLSAPPSFCDGCQRRLSFWELVPVFSYLWLRGHCRTCGAKIPIRVLLVEIGCGLMMAGIGWYLWDSAFQANILQTYKNIGIGFMTIVFFLFVFITLGLIDLQTKLILNKIVYPCLIIALVIDAFFTQRGIVNSLIGGGVGLGILLIPVLVTGGRGMGLGDVKMAALIGLTTGFGEVLVAVLGGIILGGLVAVVLVATGIRKRKDVIPFGPFLSIATIVTLIWGSQILHWYLGIYKF